MIRLNIGCGQTPTEGWHNLDNSPSIWLAKMPHLVKALDTLRVLSSHQKQYIEFARINNLILANATKRIPFDNNSVDVIYTSHMVEHLDRREVLAFLSEAHRVLKEGGVIRIAVPDVKRIVDSYTEHKDADKLVSDLYLAVPKPRGYMRIINLLIGARHHHWMYDETSLKRLLESNGFNSAISLPPGQTTIETPGALNLSERAEASIYVEARKTSKK